MIQKCLWSHWIILGWALNCLKNPRGERVQACVLILPFLFTSGWFVHYFNTYEQLLHHMWTTFTDYTLTFSSLKQEALGKNINNAFLWWSHLYLENCCHCCFPRLEGLTNHNTESFVLYYWGKESSLSSRAILYHHYWWRYLRWRRKGKRILVIQGACHLSSMNLDQFPPKYLGTIMKRQHIDRLWLFLHYLPV